MNSTRNRRNDGSMELELGKAEDARNDVKRPEVFIIGTRFQTTWGPFLSKWISLDEISSSVIKVRGDGD